MKYCDARAVVRDTIQYCENILLSKKRFTQNFQNEMRNNLIYRIDMIHDEGKYFLAFKNREYMDLGSECGYAYTWGQPDKRGPSYGTAYYQINGPIPDNWRPTKSPSSQAGYFFCDGYQPYYDRKYMKNYVDCLYELLDLLNSL